MCLKVIAELSEFIIDELKLIKKYAKFATKYKNTHKELADMFYGMANSKMTHLKNMHSWEVKFIDKQTKEQIKEIPQGMLDVWDWKHDRMIDEFNESEIMLQMYQKL